jgi:deazaflavin-dependent oxidoreductase (nitroreductase family)
MKTRILEFLMRFPATRVGAATDRWCVRATGHSFVNWLVARISGAPYLQPLLLVTLGARTKRWRSVVLPHYPADGDDLAVVGSNGGAPSDPHWVFNLRAHPDAWIHLARRKIHVRARFADGEQRRVLWEQISRCAAVYLEYQKRAEGHREIPIVILSRR